MMRRSGGMGGGEVMRSWRAVGGVGGLNRSPPKAGGRGRTGRIGAFSSSSSSSQTSPTSPSSPPARPCASESMAGLRSYPCYTDEDWNMIENLEKQGNDGGVEFYENYVFGRAPSIVEFKEAISTFNDVFPFNISQVTEDGRQSWYEDSLDGDSSDDDSTDKVSSVDKDSVDNDSINEGPTATSDWTEPTLKINNNNCLDIERSQNGLDIQRHLGVINFLGQLEQNSSLEIVSSIGTDNGVWQAVMNNEVVQELRKSFYGDGALSPKSLNPKSSDECHDAHGGGVGWVVNTTKAKIVEVFEQIRKLLGSLFHSKEAGDSEAFKSALGLPMKIVVMLFIIVVVHRVQRS
ncbi:hypothetical protein DsansV1_C29g0213211 [Dioscorea sansibarensis]